VFQNPKFIQAKVLYSLYLFSLDHCSNNPHYKKITTNKLKENKILIYLKKRMLPKKTAELVLFVFGLSILRPSLSSKALERSSRTALSLM